MSKLSVRVVLSVLICIGIVVGVFMTVKAASLRSARNSLGTYVLGGALVNPLHPNSSSVKGNGDFQSQGIQPYNYGDQNGGRNCESEADNPNDY